MAKISLGYRILCDFCKKSNASHKAAFRLTNRETRRQHSIQIGDTCDECMKYLVKSLKEITTEAQESPTGKEVANAAQGEDARGESSEQLGGCEGSEGLPADPDELEE